MWYQEVKVKMDPPLKIVRDGVEYTKDYYINIIQAKNAKDLTEIIEQLKLDGKFLEIVDKPYRKNHN